MTLAVNPWGLEERNRRFAWNQGDGRRKILTLVDRSSFQGNRQSAINSLEKLIATISQAGIA